MKYYLTFLFFLFCFIVSSQDYIRYHKLVSTAESYILEAENKNALLVYDSLFSQYEFCFAHDCFVALQIATLTKDTSKINTYIARCFKSGILIDYIEQDNITKELKKTEDWLKFKILQDSLNLIYSKKIDKKLLCLTVEQNAIDQHYRNNHQVLHSKHPIRRLFWNVCWLKQIQIIIEDKLVPVMQENGYLGEKLIGISEKWQSYSFQTNKIDNSVVRLIFMHYYSNKHREDYSEFLFGQLQNGNLSAVDYAIIMDFRAKWSYKRAPFFNEWHNCSDKSDKMIASIELRRSEIGLPSIKDNQEMFKRYIEVRKNKECPIEYYIKLWNH